LAEKPEDPAHEETFYEVPVRSTLNVWRRSLDVTVIKGADSSLEQCPPFFAQTKKGQETPVVTSKQDSVLHRQHDHTQIKSVQTFDEERRRIYDALPFEHKQLYVDLIDRYSRAAAFFRNKVENVDKILEEARIRQVSSKNLLLGLEKKYPFIVQ